MTFSPPQDASSSVNDGAGRRRDRHSRLDLLRADLGVRMGNGVAVFPVQGASSVDTDTSPGGYRPRTRAPLDKIENAL